MRIGGQKRGMVASDLSAWAGGVDLEQLQDVCLQGWGLRNDRRVGAAGRGEPQPGQRGEDQPAGGLGGAVSPQPIKLRQMEGSRAPIRRLSWMSLRATASGPLRLPERRSTTSSAL